MKTALVIGGGAVGLATALQLQSRGLAVTVIDPDARPLPASWGNAGHIAVEQVAPLASLGSLLGAPRRLASPGGALSLPLRDVAVWLPFGLELIKAARPSRFAAGRKALTALHLEAMPAWRRLTSRLGRPDLLRENGHFIVWETPATAAAGRRACLDACPPTVSYRDSNPSELEIISALIGRRPAGVMRCDGTAQVADVTELMMALRTAFRAAGGRVRQSKAIALAAPLNRGVVLEDGTAEGAELVVVTAGVGSAPLMASLGNRAPLIAERGYHLQASDHHWPEPLPSVTFEDRSLFVTPFRSGVRASSFLEFSRPDRPADPRKWRGLRRHLAELNLPLSGPLEEWMGSRPTLPDYLPAIGVSRRTPRLLYAFGHQHLGMTLAPLTG